MNIALIGNPNVGKTSLFNELTGLNQKVSNFPGVTIEKKQGTSHLNQTTIANIVDLPGIYSLNPESEDEIIAVNYLTGADSRPDLVLIIADASNIKRNLFLCQQVIELGIPAILVMNMMDLAEKNKLQIDIKGISNELGIPVIPMNARIGKGINELKKEIHHGSIENQQRKTFNANFSNHIIQKYVKNNDEIENFSPITDRLDNILLHPIWGYVVFIGILFIIFQAIFSWAVYPMEWIEIGFTKLGSWILTTFPEGNFVDLIVNGVLAGLSGILVFIPQIALLFLFISILEDTGYLTRVSFLLDKSLRRFGLNGKSVIPLLSGTACAVPAIMSARSISDPKERLITIFITPLMSCSARIPVYTLLIAMLTPAASKVGIFNLQGLLMLSLYLIGLLAAIGSGFLLKLIIKKRKKAPFIFEIPVYRLPQWKSVFINVYFKVKSFVVEAGKIIIAISIILWSLASFGPGYNSESNETELFSIQKTEQLTESYAGKMGKMIEPVIKPLGFDWKIGISLITSFAAREVFVGTMATIYSIENADDIKSVKENMNAAYWPGTNLKVYSTATICSLLIFYAFALQCMSTVAVVRKETRSWKWPMIQLVYLSILAYGFSFLVYNLLS